METQIEKTLRDEIAMSMPFESIPTLEYISAMKLAAEHLGIFFDVNKARDNDATFLLDFSIEYQAAIRYKFADAMMNARKQD